MKQKPKKKYTSISLFHEISILFDFEFKKRYLNCASSILCQEKNLTLFNNKLNIYCFRKDKLNVPYYKLDPGINLLRLGCVCVFKEAYRWS